MRNKTFSYHALCDVRKSPGVAKKIHNTVRAAEDLGYFATSKIYMVSSKLSFFVSMLKEQSDVIYVRSHSSTAFLLFFILVVKRGQGKKIIVDVPTPKIAALKEINSLQGGFFSKVLAKLILLVSGSWVLLPAHRIVQYADEGSWFSLGLKNKTIKIGNGINIDSVTPLVTPVLKENSFNLIAVAQLADWHGYDRLIHAIALLKESQPSFRVTLKIVGEGDALFALKKLVGKLSLEGQVFFTGLICGKDLDDAFEGVHIAVSSLGLYSKGLSEASDLKTREYMARGLCVIGTGKDPDFPVDSPYRFLVPNSSEAEPLAKLIYKLKDTLLPPPESVRAYAQRNLSLKNKLEQILNIKA